MDGTPVIQQMPCAGSLGTSGDVIRQRDVERRSAVDREAAARAKHEEMELKAREQEYEEGRRKHRESVARGGPCGGDWDDRWAWYARTYPTLAPLVMKKMNEADGMYVGMPEDAARILMCHSTRSETVRQVNHVTMKWIVLDGVAGPKYVGIRDGVVYSVTR